MNITKLYPGGRPKAFNVSYDDGVLQDTRFVALLNKYGLKGTFNLNSGLMRREFTWTHESGLCVTRLSESAAKNLYTGHEVASHTLTHPYMDSLSRADILIQLETDRMNLEHLFGREILGFAVPFLYYSEEIASCARQTGFAYARISEITGDYSVPTDPYYWRGSKFHWDDDLEAFIEGFLATGEEVALCQLVGHSYDLDVLNLWERMNTILARIADCPDVAPMTNLELVRYTAAMSQAEIHEDRIANPTPLDLWFRAGGRVLVLHPGEEKIL